MGRQRKLFGGRIPAIAGQEAAFYAVCVFSPDSGRPIEIATRSPNPRSETKLVRSSDGTLHYHVWVIDRGQARAIKQECQRVLDKAGKRLDGRHFDITVAWAKRVIQFAAQERGIRLYTDADLVKMSLTKEELDIIDMMRQSDVVLHREEKL